MSLTDEQVKNIAHLARLTLPDAEIPNYTQSLSDILGLVEQLNQADTANTQPLAHPLDLSQRLREDVVSEVDQRDKVQQIAPQVEAGLYLVPKVID